MKSPWKFVAQLISRRRSPDTPDDRLRSEGEESGAKAVVKALPSPAPKQLLEHELRLPGDQGSIETADQTSSVKAERGAPAVVPTSVAGSTEATPGISDQSDAAEQASELQSMQPNHSARQPRGARTGKNETQQGEPAPPAQRESVEPATAKAGPLLQSELTGNPLTDLDNEIRALRGQLSEKLRQQNAQLRTMLKRYES